MRTLIALALWGCKTPRPSETESDTDTDSDTDSDTDADSDTDTDSDADSDSDTDTDWDTDCGLFVVEDLLVVPVDSNPVGPSDNWRVAGWAAVELDGVGWAELQTSSSFAVHTASGAAAAAVPLPTTVFVRAIGGGAGTLSVTQPGCPDLAEVPLSGRAWTGLAGVPRVTGPSVRFVNVVPSGDPVVVAIDPDRLSDRVGQTADVYLVDNRDRGEWIADRSLVDVRGAPTVRTLVGGGLTANTWPLDGLPTAPSLPGRYDVVWDADRDGQLGPGDLIDGLEHTGLFVMSDLSAAGPFVIETVDFDGNGDPWLEQRISWPAGTLQDPAPLVVITHGVGHEFTYYDDLADHLASWGYVVLRHRTNAGAGVLTVAGNTLENTDALLLDPGQRHPDLVGRIDGTRITWIGHSRGGEGVVRAYAALVAGTGGVSAFGAEDIALLSSIAPTVLLGPVAGAPGPVPYHQLAGSADGDVTGGLFFAESASPCGLCQWYRLFQGADGPRVVTYLQGAAHNDVLCDGCGIDDGLPYSPRTSRDEVRAVARREYVTLLGAFVMRDSAFYEILQRSHDDLPRPTGLPAALQFQPGDATVLDDFESGDSTTSSRGTPVTTTVSDLDEGAQDDANTTFAWDGTDPQNGLTWSDNDAQAPRGASFGWSGEAVWQVELPASERDLAAHGWLSLRIAQGTRHPSTLALDGPLEFGIALVDGAGTEVELSSSAYAGVTSPYGRVDVLTGLPGWANEFVTVRVALEDFESLSPAFDRSDVRSMALRFGAGHGSAEGFVALDDLQVE